MKVGSNWCWRRGCCRADGKAPPRLVAEMGDGEECLIRANPDRKSREMGLFPGAHVHMLRNRPRAHALVLACGEMRVAISRAIAARIEVEPTREGRA